MQTEAGNFLFSLPSNVLQGNKKGEINLNRSLTYRQYAAA